MSTNNNIKVLHIFKTYFPDTYGGLERVIEQICLQSQDFGTQSDILTLSKVSKMEIIQRPEARVFRFPLSLDLCSSPISLALLFKFRDLAKDYDILHYHFPWPFADFLHTCSFLKTKTLVSYHSDIVKQKKMKALYAPLMKKFLGQVDAIVATSDNYLETSTDLAPYKDKTSVIPICIDEQAYPTVSEERSVFLRHTYGEDFFFFVGVLRHYKGLHVLIDAVEGSSCKCVIAGEGPLAPVLKKMVTDKGLGEQIKFTGKVNETDKMALFHLCKAVVFPSHLRAEAYGVTLLEGAMMGKPLISTELGTGTSYVNVHNRTGLVVPPSDSDALRKAMLFFAENQQKAVSMGREARKRYEQTFRTPAMGRAYAKLYRRLYESAERE